MSAGKIVLLIFGILLVLVSFGLIISGGIILAVDNTFKDSEGFYSTGFARVVAPNSSAVVSDSAEINIGPGWFRRNPITLKVEVSNNLPDKQVFAGIARDSDMRSYLSGAAYDEVTGVTFQPFEVDLLHHPGTAVPPAPANQTIWVASASGPGLQTLEWDVTSGTYTLVIMNTDGSAPVDVQASLGVKIPLFLFGIGLGVLIAGIVLLAGGGVMIFLAVRR